MRLFSSIQRYARDLVGAPQPDARVDAAQFSEADYPVFCMTCGYELRGLTEPRCPECGAAFDRGQLLVEQYVRLRRPRSDGRYRFGRRIGWLGWSLFATPFVAYSCLAVLCKRWPEPMLEFVIRNNVPFPEVIAIPAGAMVVGWICGLLSVVLKLSRIPPLEKRRAVKAAWRAGRRKNQK